MKKRNDIQYKELLRRFNELERMNKIGVQLYTKKSKIKIAFGIICILIAVFPNGLGLIFYPLGLSLLISGGVDLMSFKKKMLQKIKFRFWRFKHGC